MFLALNNRFKECTSLEKIIRLDCAIEIGAGTFDGCPCLEDLKKKYPDMIKDTPKDENGHAVIPNGTEEIEDMVF